MFWRGHYLNSGMRKEQHQIPSTRDINSKPCPTCEEMMRFTGLPDVSGPIYFRIYSCQKCGYVRSEVEDESPVGWG